MLNFTRPNKIGEGRLTKLGTAPFNRQASQPDAAEVEQLEILVLDILQELVQMSEAEAAAQKLRVAEQATRVCVDLIQRLKSAKMDPRESLDANELQGLLKDHATALRELDEDEDGGSLRQCLERNVDALGKRLGHRFDEDRELSEEPNRWEMMATPTSPNSRTTTRHGTPGDYRSIGGVSLAKMDSRPSHQGLSLNGTGASEYNGSKEAVGDGAREESDSRWPPLLPDRRLGGPLRRLHILFDEGSKSLLGRAIVTFVTLTLAVSTVTFVMESMPEFRKRSDRCDAELTVEACQPKPLEAFWEIETFCIIVFTVDYLVRVLTAHAPEKGKSLTLAQGTIATLRYATQPINLVDLLAIAPYYIELASGNGLGSLEILRLARICRIFKMARHHPGMKMFAKVMYKSGQPFFILVFFLIIICLLFASLMHFAEGQKFSVHANFTQPGVLCLHSAEGDHLSLTANLTQVQWSEDWDCEEKQWFKKGAFVRPARYPDVGDHPTPFRSIPVAMWWVCVTLTTVGYGDIYPTTPVGKFVGIVCFYTGILFLALPISILGSNFESVYEEEYSRPPDRPKLQRKHSKGTCGPERVWSEAPLFPSNGLGAPLGLRQKIFIFLEQPSSSKLGRVFSVFVMMVILAVTLSFVMESMPEFNDTPPECDLQQLSVQDCEPRPVPAFASLEVFGIVVFTVDYILRVLTVHTSSPEDCGLDSASLVGSNFPELRTTWLYATQWMNVIDLLAIVPFYVQAAMGGNSGGGMSVIRVLRLTRIFRVLRMRKLQSGVSMFAAVLRDSLPALSLLGFMTMLACLFFASCITYAEGSTYSVDPEWLQDYPQGLFIRPAVDGYSNEPSPFSSIVYAFWWFFVTATTVGYGDDYPTTTAGRMVGLLTVYCGIILLALPISVIGSNFGAKYTEWEAELHTTATSTMRSTPESQSSPRSMSSATDRSGRMPSMDSGTGIGHHVERRTSDSRSDSHKADVDEPSKTSPTIVGASQSEAPPPVQNGDGALVTVS